MAADNDIKKEVFCANLLLIKKKKLVESCVVHKACKRIPSVCWKFSCTDMCMVTEKQQNEINA